MGRLTDIVPVPKAGPVASFLPISVLFGLAMDYQVFLVSRMREEREEYAKGADARARTRLNRSPSGPRPDGGTVTRRLRESGDGERRRARGDVPRAHLPK